MFEAYHLQSLQSDLSPLSMTAGQSSVTEPSISDRFGAQITIIHLGMRPQKGADSTGALSRGTVGRIHDVNTWHALLQAHPLFHEPCGRPNDHRKSTKLRMCQVTRSASTADTTYESLSPHDHSRKQERVELRMREHAQPVTTFCTPGTEI